MSASGARFAAWLMLCNIAFGSSTLLAQGTNEALAPDRVVQSPPPAVLAELAEQFEHAADLRIELVAAEPLLQHPVAFAVDEHGRVFVAETHRHHQGVTDIREHTDWLDDDLAAQTVADRLAYMRRQTGDDFDDYAANADRVRLLIDTDDDGLFDSATTFAGDFSTHAAGIGAGLLVRDGEVTYACIPDLWRLIDSDNDGIADQRRALSSGYGVRISLLGHDLHGLIMGPDGRLWFSIGDRGLHVETPNGVLALPDQGAVLRCEPDGSALEIVHTGLRNPQELAFDDFGNLFTVDNNSDGGDLARLVQVLPGADSGWRQPFQWLSDRGPWKLEDWWRSEQHEVFFRLPPLAHLASGPSGLVSDPGGMFPEPFTGGMLLADFLGDPESSGVLGFQLEASGAGFALRESSAFISGVLATDVDVDPQGRLLISDWVDGWNRNARGRLWRVAHVGELRVAEGERRAAELARPFSERNEAELLVLLDDPDRRLRTRAHLELATRAASWDALQRVVDEHSALRPRWHALAALGVAARRHESAVAQGFAAHSLDREPELRALALQLLGELEPAGAAQYVLPRLGDEHPRVRLFAALAAAQLGTPTLSDALLARLRSADAEEPNLLHAFSSALASCTPSEQLTNLHDAAERGVRLGAVLALRQLRDGGVAAFLNDSDPALRSAAARALWDTRLAAEQPGIARQLAARLTLGEPPEGLQEPVLRRAMAAAETLGDEQAAEQLIAFSLRSEASVELRGLALDALVDWELSATRDPVLGHWAPRAAREHLPSTLFAGHVSKALAKQPADLLTRWLALIERHELSVAAMPLLRTLLRSRRLPGAVRAKAFSVLTALGDGSPMAPEGRAALTAWALGDRSERVRAAALKRLPDLGEQHVIEHLPALLREGTLLERRVALGLAAAIDDPLGEQWLVEQWQAHATGAFPVELELDLLQAIPQQPGESYRALRRAALNGQARMTLDGPRSSMLFGGSRESGARLFERSELSCVRCHSREGEDSGDYFVGPSLAGLGERLSRQQIYESLRQPNARLAPGFQNEHLFLLDGGLLTGRVLTDSAARLVVLDADGERHVLQPEQVSERRSALSAMPEQLVEQLTPSELRDLIAYLANL